MKDMTFLKECLIAHRGVYDNKRIYENTISAYTRAMKYNYPIELDLRLLKDGVVVCFHDDDTEKMLHVEGCVEDLTYDELCYLARYQIPTFESVLELVHGVVPLLIELKSVTRKMILESTVASMLDNYNGKFAIQSFNIKTLKWFYKNRPDFIIGYLVGKRNYKKETLFKKYDFLGIKHGLYNRKRIKKVRENYMVLGWGIENSDELVMARDIFDNLVCDNILDIDNNK